VSALFGKMVKDMEVNFEITTRHKATFECLQETHASDFPLVIPLNGLDQHMSPI
jgi:hypothetical protein